MTDADAARRNLGEHLSSSDHRPEGAHGLGNNVTERLDCRTHPCHKAANKKYPNIFQKEKVLPKHSDFGVGRGGGNSNHHFVVVTRVEQVRFADSPDDGPRHTHTPSPVGGYCVGCPVDGSSLASFFPDASLFSWRASQHSSSLVARSFRSQVDVIWLGRLRRLRCIPFRVVAPHFLSLSLFLYLLFTSQTHTNCRWHRGHKTTHVFQSCQHEKEVDDERVQ